MTVRDEQRKVLDMLAAGQITADQAAALLAALADSTPPPPPAAAGLPRRGTARMLRISVDAADEDGGDRAKIRVNVPLGLAKFASRFMPAEARRELEGQGIDLGELINAISTETPEGPLVDIDVDDERGEKRAKIIIEVV
jgi:hypothetical protein